MVSNGAVGLWALLAHRFTVARTRVLWWCTGAAQLTTVAQAVIGVVLVNRFGFELDSFHALYGFSTIIAAAIIYSYRQQMAHKLYLLYAGGGLFIMGLGIRAMFLGGG